MGFEPLAGAFEAGRSFSGAELPARGGASMIRSGEAAQAGCPSIASDGRTEKQSIDRLNGTKSAPFDWAGVRDNGETGVNSSGKPRLV
jgi:hypothetical protein